MHLVGVIWFVAGGLAVLVAAVAWTFRTAKTDRVRYVIHRSPQPPVPECWLGAISVSWTTDWGSRRLFKRKEDAMLQVEDLKASGATGTITVIPVYRSRFE